MFVLLCLRSAEKLEKIKAELVKEGHVVYMTTEAKVAQHLITGGHKIDTAVVEVELDGLSGLFVPGMVNQREFNISCLVFHHENTYKGDELDEISNAHHWINVFILTGVEDYQAAVLEFVGAQEFFTQLAGPQKK